MGFLGRRRKDLEIVVNVRTVCSGDHSSCSVSRMTMLRFATTADTLEESLAEYLKDTESTETCEVCSFALRQRQIITTIGHLPRLLLMNPQRVAQDRTAARVHRHMMIPKVYQGRKLVGAILQRSSGPTTGHYVTIVFVSGHWWLFDDDKMPRVLTPDAAHQQIEEDATVFVFQSDSDEPHTTEALEDEANDSGNAPPAAVESSDSGVSTMPPAASCSEAASRPKRPTRGESQSGSDVDVPLPKRRRRAPAHHPTGD